jgi:hypothetical protein
MNRSKLNMDEPSRRPEDRTRRIAANRQDAWWGLGMRRRPHPFPATNGHIGADRASVYAQLGLA